MNAVGAKKPNKPSLKRKRLTIALIADRWSSKHGPYLSWYEAFKAGAAYGKRYTKLSQKYLAQKAK